jgi:hypothetical protein
MRGRFAAPEGVVAGCRWVWILHVGAKGVRRGVHIGSGITGAEAELRRSAELTCEMRPICNARCGSIGSPNKTRGNAFEARPALGRPSGR